MNQGELDTLIEELRGGIRSQEACEKAADALERVYGFFACEAECTCCQESMICHPECTFAEDYPSSAERVVEVREALWGPGEGNR